MEEDEKWFTQKKQFGRPVVNSWQGAAVAFVALAALAAMALLFLSLDAFAPGNFWLLGLWLILALALIVAFHAFARPRTDRPWQRKLLDDAGMTGEPR